MFITFEGIEGCGKSTQAKLLFDHLRRENYPVVLTYEPGDSPVGQKLREILLSDAMDPLTEALLFLADRREHIVNVIRPALRENRIVISDRFVYSTLAYQVYGRNLSPSWIHTVHDHILEGIIPERIYVLDLDVEEAFERKKHQPFDRIEKESLAFHQRVREGFLALARSSPNALILDATLPPHILHQTILEDIHTHLLSTRGG